QFPAPAPDTRRASRSISHSAGTTLREESGCFRAGPRRDDAGFRIGAGTPPGFEPGPFGSDDAEPGPDHREISQRVRAARNFLLDHFPERRSGPRAANDASHRFSRALHTRVRPTDMSGAA